MSSSLYFESTVTEVHHWTDRLFSFRGTREPGFRFASGQFAMIGLPPIDITSDRFMLCGSPQMLRDTQALLDGYGLKEGNMSTPGHYVIERAFVDK